MKSAAELARALQAKPAGKDRWTSRCPAHNDKDPSFSISDIGGMALFHCHAGCSQEQVIDALGRRGLWNGNGNGYGNGGATIHTFPESGRPDPGPLQHPQFGKPQKRYDYYDRGGHLIGAICRWDRDGKKEIRPATLSNGQWVWVGFPKPHPLYRLGDLLAQPSRPVLVVEGEKAADAARDLITSHTVTTWPHGASSVAQADWSPLKGRDVVLWPDADEPGLKAMREVGAALRTIGAQSIRLVKLPEGLPAGWDLGDAIPGVVDIERLITEARDAAAERIVALGLTTASDLSAMTFRPLQCAVPDLVPEGLGLLAGKPKTGKSWMGFDICIAVAGGTYALGNIKCEQGPVLYLALEDTLRRAQGRMRAILQGAPAPAALTIATEWKRADEGGLDDIRAWLAMNRNARLILIDTLQKMRGSRKKDAGVYEDDYRAIADFKKLADEFTVPIVLVHHLNKQGNDDPLMAVSGTAGITGSADTILVLSREANENNAILYVRGRDVNEAEIAIQFDSETGKWLKLGKAQDWRISEERRAIVKLLMEEGSLHPKEIAHMLGKKPNTIHFLLHKMVKDGDLKRMADGRYTL